MLALALQGLDTDAAQVVVVVLAEHVEKFDAVSGVRQALGPAVEVLVLPEPTSSQADTVAQALRRLKPDGHFLVKDSDNSFTLDPIEQLCNYVAVDSLNNHDLINPRNKSYLQVDHNDSVVNIREKEVVSDLFSVGGYYFTDAGAFVAYYDRLTLGRPSWMAELYISDIIGSMILDGVPFLARPVEDYSDWGTVHEWRRSMHRRQCFFFLVDGFLLERGSPYFYPRFQDVKSNPVAVDAALQLHRLGHDVRYLSVRPQELEALTREQLGRAGLPAAPILFECPTTTWTIVTSPHPTVPVPTSAATEISVDDANMLERLRPTD